MKPAYLKKALGILDGTLSVSASEEVVILDCAGRFLLREARMRRKAIDDLPPLKPAKTNVAREAKAKAILEFAYHVKFGGKALGDYYYHELGAVAREGDEQARIARAILAHGVPVGNKPVLVRDFIKHAALVAIVRKNETATV